MKIDKNCLSYWYPLIAYDVPTPDTFWVKLNDGWRLADMLDGKTPWQFDSLCRMLEDAAEQIGTPCFLRTGQGSGKHNWKNCCYVSNVGDIPQHVYNLIEWSHMVDMMGLPHDVWAVRKMLPTRPLFRCTEYGGMPVVPEWRYFVDGQEVLYGIPYWPEDALEQGAPDDADWRRHLGELQAEPDRGKALASKAGKLVGGKWSVDVLKTDEGSYVTDMALAECSWGWNG